MLKRVEIENFHGFKDKIILDFSDTKNYSYSKNLLKNKLVKNAIVFGKNGSGKSSLCLGIVDITLHLLDCQKDVFLLQNYTYAGKSLVPAEFTYVFQFGKKEVKYRYQKIGPLSLMYEEILVNNKKIMVHDYYNEKNNFINIKGASNIRTNGLQKELSCVKYIYNNTIQNEDSVISLIMDFASRMLYFRSLSDGSCFIGYKLGYESLDDVILKNEKLKDFQDFLNELGISYNLVNLEISNGKKGIGIKFDNNSIVPFNEIVSSGTRALKLFYCWLLEFEKLSFLVIDEFDAFYSIETSQAILKRVNSFQNMQTLVTTHNVTLLNTEYTRPDCAYLLDEKGIKTLSSRYDKDLRISNNIEKMYRSGEFLN